VTEWKSRTWDGDNRLVGVSTYEGQVTTMTYNADGLRVKVQKAPEAGGGTDQLTWDFQNLISPDDGATARFAYQPGLYGDLVHNYRGGGGTSFYLYDALGSTIGLTDASKNLTDTYLYKAYGNVLATSGSTANPFGWVGRYGYHRDNFLAPDWIQYYIRQRHYGPDWAAWLSRDPLGLSLADPNVYRYAANRPTVLVDPSGEAVIVIVIDIILVIIVGGVIIGIYFYYQSTPQGAQALRDTAALCERTWDQFTGGIGDLAGAVGAAAAAAVLRPCTCVRVTVDHRGESYTQYEPSGLGSVSKRACRSYCERNGYPEFKWGNDYFRI
jgi:RHS repeat-associated protein